MKLTVAGIFCGAGGLDLGFAKNQSFEFVWANEIDKKACETYRKNFVKIHEIYYLKEGDIRHLWSQMPQNIDILIGGPPCQSWSTAGKGLGLGDVRGQLIFESVKIIESRKPKIVVWENVVGLTQLKHTEAFSDLLNKIHTLGYKVTHRVLDLWKYGIPQNRRRVIIIAVREDQEFEPWSLYPDETHKSPISLDVALQCFQYLLDEADRLGTSILNFENFRYKKEARNLLADVLEPGEKFRIDPEEKNTFKKSLEQRIRINEFMVRASEKIAAYDFSIETAITKQIDFMDLMKPHTNELGGIGSWTEEETWDWLVEAFTEDHWFKTESSIENLKAEVNKALLGKSSFLRDKIGQLKPNPEKPINTIVASSGEQPFWHPYEERGFSVRELAFLQTFPMTFEFYGTIKQQYKQVGNAVPPHFSSLLADKIAQIVSHAKHNGVSNA
jgi:DNA (cytosine-5)-methyltransferase 1